MSSIVNSGNLELPAALELSTGIAVTILTSVNPVSEIVQAILNVLAPRQLVVLAEYASRCPLEIMTQHGN